VASRPYDLQVCRLDSGIAGVRLFMTGISQLHFVEHLVDQDRLTVACGLSLLPPRWRDDEALGSHLDHHVRHPAENTYDFREVLAQNSRRLRLAAAEPDVLPDGVPSPAARELGVVRDQGCAAVGGIDGDSVIGRVIEVRLRGRPALMARVEQNSADGDGDVVVEEEPQGGEVLAGRRMAITDDGDVGGRQPRVGRQDFLLGGPLLQERFDC